MSTALLRIFVRVVNRRIEEGEDLETILNGYDNLSEEDKQQVREAIQNGSKLPRT